MGQRRPRVLVVVLNESTLDLVGKWAEDGSLPACRRMIQNGLHGRLRSRPPLMGPERWGNLVTGQEADRHGLTEFVHRDERGDFSPIRFGPKFGLQADPIWRLLSRQGLRCGVVNAPLAYSQDVPHGFVVQDLLDAFAFRLAPGDLWRRQMSGPTALFDAVRSRFGEPQVSPHDLEREAFVSLLEAQLERQAAVLRYLLESREWDFCLTRFTQVADAQHHLWGDMVSRDPAKREGLPRVYRAADRAIGTLLDVAGPDTTVLVVSDCGAGPLRAGIHVPTWLAKEGFLRRSQRKRGRAEAVLAEGSPPNGGLRAAARRVLPRPVWEAAARAKQWLKPPAKQVGDDGEIDWTATKAYWVGIEGGIAINLRGREPGGIVAPGAEYRAVCDELTSRLHQLVDPETGEPAVERVRTVSELYGPAVAKRTADLFPEWRGAEYLSAEVEGEDGSVFVTHRQRGKQLPVTGGHRPDGLLLAIGPGFQPGGPRQASVFDVVPTCLRLLEQPIPATLRGQSLI